MIDRYRNGHAESCPAPNDKCTCEPDLYKRNGFLALLAAFLEGSIGLLFGSSFAFSDAIHALVDSGTDFFGAFIAKRADTYPKQGHKVRTFGDKVIAIAIVIATIPIFIEILYHDAELVAEGMFLAGFVAVCINGYRWKKLHQAQQVVTTSTRQSLINHVKGDIAHSIYVMIAGLLFSIAGWMKISQFFSITLGEASSQYVWQATPQNLDSILPFGVILYLLWQAHKTWTGKGHKHHH